MCSLEVLTRFLMFWFAERDLFRSLAQPQGLWDDVWGLLIFDFSLALLGVI